MSRNFNELRDMLVASLSGKGCVRNLRITLCVPQLRYLSGTLGPGCCDKLATLELWWMCCRPRRSFLVPGSCQGAPQNRCKFASNCGIHQPRATPVRPVLPLLARLAAHCVTLWWAVEAQVLPSLSLGGCPKCHLPTLGLTPNFAIPPSSKPRGLALLWFAVRGVFLFSPKSSANPVTTSIDSLFFFFPLPYNHTSGPILESGMRL